MFGLGDAEAHSRFTIPELSSTAERDGGTNPMKQKTAKTGVDRRDFMRLLSGTAAANR